MFTVAYDSELGLWAILTPDGYTHDYETTKATALRRCRVLNFASGHGYQTATA